LQYRIMVVGPVGSGKSTLIAALQGKDLKVRKTQALKFDAHTIDTPGEYIENPRFYRALLATAWQADYVLFLQDATMNRSYYPPGIAQTFPGHTLGVITKVDCRNANVVRAGQFLKALGLKGETYCVSSVTGSGLTELKQCIRI